MSGETTQAVRHLSKRLSKPIGNFVHAVEVPPGTGLLFLSGLTSRADDGSVMHLCNAAAQTERILQNMTTLLNERGLDLSHVVKVVVYVKDMADLSEIHRIRSEHFVAAMPASTLVQVSDFVDPAMLLEIDAVACIPAAQF